MASRINGLSHPAGTSHITTHQRVGLQVGNGNHCDYFVAEVRTFDMPRDVLQKHYAGQTFTNPISRQQDPVQIVFLADKLGSSRLPYDFENLSAWSLPQDVPLEKLYAVVVFYVYEANADMRCH